MARMSVNDECPGGNFCDSSQLTNWILYYGSKCHIKPEVSDFNPGSLEDMDKHIEVADRHHVTAKQIGQVRIKSETSGVMWHVAPESKIQLVNCELSQKFPLGHSSLPDMRAIDACIFCSLLF